jgi:hypothetical protein
MLDESLIVKKTSFTLPPQWIVCKYCKVPFLTQTFEDSCNRCKHIVKYKIEFANRVMFYFILLNTASSILFVLISMLFISYKINTKILFFILVSISLISGGVMWKMLKKVLD